MIQRLVQTVWTGLGWNFTTSKKLITTIPPHPTPPPQKKKQSRIKQQSHPRPTPKKNMEAPGICFFEEFPCFFWEGWGGSYEIISHYPRWFPCCAKNPWIWRFFPGGFGGFGIDRQHCDAGVGMKMCFFDGMAATWDVEPQIGQKKHGEGSSQLKNPCKEHAPRFFPNSWNEGNLLILRSGWYSTITTLFLRSQCSRCYPLGDQRFKHWNTSKYLVEHWQVLSNGSFGTFSFELLKKCRKFQALRGVCGKNINNHFRQMLYIE